MSTTYERRKQISVQRNAARAEHLKTPAMRRAEAQAAAARSRAARQAQEAEQKAKISAAQDNVNPLLRGVSTVGRVKSKLLTGALGAVEGIVDLGIGAVGAVGGLVSEDFREGAKQAVKYNATEEWVGKHLDELTKYSYTEGNKAGEIVEGVAEGVGQMLPAVIATVATGGAAAGSMAGGAAKLGAAASKLGMGVTMASAAGNATQQAYEDGADYYEGLGYGVASGAVEGATEKLTGGVANKLTGFGKGIIKDSAGKVASQGIKRIAKEAVGEGAEEALAELANPMLKTIYKGKDAINEYFDGEYWQGVGESALVGALTSVAFGQTVGRAVGGNADINASLEAIKEIDDSFYTGDSLNENVRAQMHTNVGKNLENVEKVLQKTSAEKRAKLIEQYRLGKIFDENGSMRAEFSSENGFKITDGQTAAQNTNASPAAFSAYQSPSLSLQGNKVKNDLSTITEELRTKDIENGGTGQIANIEIYEGELSENSKAEYSKFKKGFHTLNKKMGGGLSFALVKPNSSFNGVRIGNTVYISADNLSDGAWKKTLIHEVTHATEGTEAYAKYMSFLGKDEGLVSDAMDTIVNQKPDYGFTDELADRVVEKMGVDANMQTNDASPKFSYLGKSEDGRDIYKTNYEPNTPKRQKQEDIVRLVQDVWSKNPIQLSIVKNGKEQKISVAFDPDLSERSDLAKIAFGNRKGSGSEKRITLNLSSDLYRIAETSRYVSSKNETGKENIAHKDVSEWHYFVTNLIYVEADGSKADCYMNIDVKKKSNGNWFYSFAIEKGVAPQTLHAVVTDESATTPDSTDQLLNMNETTSPQPTPEASFDGSTTNDSIPEVEEFVKDLGEKYFTDEEKSFLSEIGAHMSEKLLGEDEVFIEKLVRGNTTVAEKTLNMIAEAKRAVASLQSSDTRAKYNRLRRAEKLYLKAVSAAGMTYRNGKITRREEEKTIEFSRMNSRSFSENVRAISKMTDEHAQENLSQGNFVSVMKHTPSVILDNVKDAEDLEVIVRFDAIYLATRKEGVAKGHYHDLGVEVASKIPEFISNPDAIIRLDNGRINLLARMTDTNGKQGIISVELNTVKDINSQNTKYNLVISAFNAKDNYIKNILHKAIKTEYKKEDLPQVNPQLYEWLATVNEVSSKDSISQPDENVNPKTQFSRKKNSSNLTKNQALKVDMNELERAEILRSATITPSKIEIRKDFNLDFAQLEKNEWKIVKKPMIDKLRELGFLKSYTTDKIDIAFEFTGEGLRKSTNSQIFEYGGSLADLAKVVMNMQSLLDSSVLIEIHSDKAIGSPRENSRLLRTYVLLGAFCEGKTITPVQFEIKQYVDDQNRLYLAVALTKIEASVISDTVLHSGERTRLLPASNEASVISDTMPENQASTRLLPTSNISIPQLIAKINPKDKNFFKYIPNEFLNEAQLNAKRDALRLEAKKYGRESEEKIQFSRKSDPRSENERAMKRISNEIRKEVNQGQPATASTLLKDNLKLSKNLETSQNKVKSLKEENKNIQEYAKACNRCIYLVNQIRDLKSGKYIAASEYQNHAFKEGFEKLSKLLWRGNIRNALAVREELKKLYDWYVNPKNRLFHDESGNKTEDFNHVLVNTLEELGSGEGSFTVNDIKALEKTLEAVKHHIDTYNKVWNGERWIDTRDEGVRFVRSIERNKEYRGGWYYRFFASGKYQRTFADNASVFRAADCYDEHGFFTEYFEALREGLIGTQIAEMELREELESFYKKHKNYVKRLTKDKIEYKGKDIAVRQYLSLYMTSKRKQSYLAFAKTGFKLHDEQGNAVNFGPLASDPASIESEEQAQAHVEKMRKELEQKLTKEDLEYVAILERAYVKCAELKREMDMIRWGYSNVISSYYYPIKKADTAENVDESFFIEVERTSNLSFNKSTVKNAGRLFIEPVDTVFNRHVRGIALYSNLAMTVENMNRVLNVNVSDTPQSNSLGRQIKENKYLRDSLDALKKLKNDIEGMRIVEDAELSRFIGKLRSNYARSALAANPKIFLTQLSSFFAATSILNYQNMVKGFGVSNKSAEVDKYCSLAKLRNTDNTVVKAQTVSDKAGKVSDVLLTPVGKIDRWVVVELFGGCQVQIEAEGGPKLGTEANKIEAGKLLERVILETQQNTLLTEKSAAMRSSQEYMKFLTMFSADAMKVMGRVYDGMGEVTVLKAKSRALKADPNKNAATIAALQKERNGVTEELKKKREEQAENDSDARLLDNAKQILQMKSVKDLKGDEFADDGKHSLRERVVAFFDSFGNKVLSEELGEVSVTRSSFRDDKAHGLTYNKVISFAAVPEVLKSGKIIDIWKPSGKPYERITVAAPITIGEKKYYMGVMVQKDIQSNRMYLHDVIREEATLSFTTEPTAKNGEGIRDEGHLFITSVLQNALKVNRELKKNIPDLENQIADLENRAAALDKQIEELKNEPAQTEKKLKQAKKKLARSTAALAASSVFMAAIALFFKWLYGKTRDEEKEDIAKDTLFDLFGNMLGGLPLVRDIYSAIAEGFDVDVFNMSALNDLIDSCRECYELAAMAASGDEVTDTDIRSAMKKSLSAVGMMFGIPVRNTYNLVTGLTKRISPSAGYWIDSQFYSHTYTSDLKEAIENDDEKMISTIAGLIAGENFDGVSKAAQSSVRELISKGYTGVLPRSVGDTVTYDGEQIELSARQKKRFREVYGIADESVDILVTLPQYRDADDEVKAKAIKFIYDSYYGLALEELVGAENSKLTLFAEAFDIEKLALIISTARSFESDKDRNGKVIQGSKKAKIIKYLESLRMSAAQKHMLLGYLGYNQTKGREKVEAYIGTLRLTKDEKAALLEHSGYAVA